MKRLPAITVIVLLLAATTAEAWEWTPYFALSENYIHPPAPGSSERMLVLATATPFHTCGLNNIGQVRSSTVGDEMFDTLTATFLVAWTSDKTVSFLIDGCDGDRMKVVGIKLAK